MLTLVMKFLWKTLIQGHIDYCSQLYLPSKATELQQIENLQKWYSQKIPELQHLDYWAGLKALHMYSQQRRMERYRIIYAWKILEGLAPNCGLEFQSSERRGRELIVPQLNGRTAIKSLRSQSFQVNSPQLFNALPKSVRDTTKSHSGRIECKTG